MNTTLAPTRIGRREITIRFWGTGYFGELGALCVYIQKKELVVFGAQEDIACVQPTGSENLVSVWLSELPFTQHRKKGAMSVAVNTCLGSMSANRTIKAFA